MNPLSDQFQSRLINQNEPEDIVKRSIKTQAQISILQSTQLFGHSPQRILCWEALLLASKNKKEEAKAIVDAIKERRMLEIDPAWNQEKPDSIDDFFDKVFLHEIWRNPQWLTNLGLFESVGLKYHNAYLNDNSLSVFDDILEEKRILLNTLKSYDVHGLKPDQQTSYKILTWKLEHEIAGGRFQFHNYFINQMWGVLQNIISTLTVDHKLEEVDDFENYICRLDCIPTQLKQTRELLDYQRKYRIFPPRFAIEKTIEFCNKVVNQPTSENVFYTYFNQQIGKVDIRDKDLLIEEVKQILENYVHNAFLGFLHYCEDFLQNIPTNHGVCALPKGDEYYAHLLAKHTTTDMTPDQVHDLGVKEVARLQAEIKIILQKENLYQEGKELGRQIREIPDNSFYYENSETGQEKCLEDFRSILGKVKETLWPLFDIKPKLPAEVLPLPEALQDGAPVAYYFLPSLDGSRNGVFYVNTNDLKRLPIHEMETLAIHEAEPGHHFQLSIQYDMDIPVLRKISIEYTAYVEGWALYAEKLAYEHGFYSSSLDEIGHLKFDLWRAARLVVDTGIHHKGWSRDEAIEYFEKITGSNHDSIVTEIERYFVIPGQACAYKIGQLKILELRQRAKDLLGDKFKIQDFHNVVLSIGAVPLQILEDAVDRYIHAKRNKD